MSDKKPIDEEMQFFVDNNGKKQPVQNMPQQVIVCHLEPTQPNAEIVRQPMPDNFITCHLETKQQRAHIVQQNMPQQ